MTYCIFLLRNNVECQQSWLVQNDTSRLMSTSQTSPTRLSLLWQATIVTWQWGMWLLMPLYPHCLLYIYVLSSFSWNFRMYYSLLIRSTNSSGVSISIFEKPNHFLPKSFMNAPIRYTSSSIQRKRSCDKRNVSTSIGAYWALWRSMSSCNWRLICWV